MKPLSGVTSVIDLWLASDVSSWTYKFAVIDERHYIWAMLSDVKLNYWTTSQPTTTDYTAVMAGVAICFYLLFVVVTVDVFAGNFIYLCKLSRFCKKNENRFSNLDVILAVFFSRYRLS